MVDHVGGDVGSPGYVPGAAPPLLAGDYNASGIVDAADYAVWRDNVNTSNTLPNDTTPGAVTAADYDVWRASFGRTAASGSAMESAAVPEPASGVMLVMAMAGVFRRACRVGRLQRRTDNPVRRADALMDKSSPSL